MSVKPKAEGWEEDDDYGDGPVEALSGSGSGTGESGAVADMLLGLIGGCSQLITLLLESDQEEFARVLPRLALLRTLVAQLPEKAPRRRQAIGFVAPARPATRPARRNNARGPRSLRRRNPGNKR